MLCDRSHINEYVTNYRYFSNLFYKGVMILMRLRRKYDCRYYHRCYYGDDANSRANADVLPKMASIVLVIIILGPWMFQELTTLILDLFDKIPSLLRSY